MANVTIPQITIALNNNIEDTMFYRFISLLCLQLASVIWHLMCPTTNMCKYATGTAESNCPAERD